MIPGLGSIGMTGSVIRVLLGKGYAFIRDENGDERLASGSDFEPLHAFNSLAPGMKVEFTPTNTGKGGNGLKALKIKVIGE